MIPQFHVVQPGDGWYTIAKRIAPDATVADLQNFAHVVAVANGDSLATLFHPGRILAVDPATIPSAAPPPPPPPPTPSSFPAWETTGPTSAPQRTVNVSGTVRTSSLAVGLFNSTKFVFDGGYIYVDTPDNTFTDCVFQGGKATSNTSALVQGSSTSRNLTFNRCEVTGGPAWNRGVQSDSGKLTVTNSRFRQCGESAIEMNNRNFTGDLEVRGCYIQGVKGWPAGTHADGIQFGSGRTCTIVGNTVDIPLWNGAVGDTSKVSNSCLGLWAELGDSGDTLVDGNQLLGGGCTMYLEQKSPHRWTGKVAVTNNVFSLKSVWNQPVARLGLPSQLVWSGNKFTNDDAVPRP